MAVRIAYLEHIVSKTTRRFLAVALYAAVPPWIASVIVTMAGAAVLSGTTPPQPLRACSSQAP